MMMDTGGCYCNKFLSCRSKQRSEDFNKTMISSRIQNNVQCTRKDQIISALALT